MVTPDGQSQHDVVKRELEILVLPHTEHQDHIEDDDEGREGAKDSCQVIL